MKRIVVFDIDDTLLRADSKNICIVRKADGKRLSTSEFALEKGSEDEYDFSEFRNPSKVRNSIVNGQLNFELCENLYNCSLSGIELCFLTARGLREVVKEALEEITGFNLSDKSQAVGDWEGEASEKKGRVLKNLCSEYDEVFFLDDDEKNIDFAKAMKLKNLTVKKVIW